jgi:hypothetical protein
MRAENRSQFDRFRAVSEKRSPANSGLSLKTAVG